MIPRSPIRKRRSKPRRVSVVRDEKYLDFLRTEGRCGVCFAGAGVPVALRPWTKIIDPAHYRTNGMGSKGSDLEAIPLCRVHHNEMESLRWRAFCAKYEFDRVREVDIWKSLYHVWKEHEAWPQPTS